MPIVKTANKITGDKFKYRVFNVPLNRLSLLVAYFLSKKEDDVQAYVMTIKQPHKD